MGLITKEVEVLQHGLNIDRYEKLGYKIIRKANKQGKLVLNKQEKIKVKVTDLSDNSTVKVNIKCDGCGKVDAMEWGYYKRKVKKDNTTYCQACANKLRAIDNNKNGSSFAQWGVNKFGEDFLDKYWSSKNSINPYDIGYGSITKIWLKCPDCFTEKFIEPNRFTMHGIACSKCSDGISYPNKFMFALLKSLNIKFEAEKYFDWCTYYYNNKYRKGIYDFYFHLNDNEYVIEMDGRFHTVYNDLSGMKAEESKNIDKEKDILAIQHNIKPIRIDSSLSNSLYLRNSILNSELSILLNLNLVDWDECDKSAQKSVLKTVCDIWNNGLTDITSIVKELNMNRNTIARYLKTGAKLNLCDYTASHSSIKKRKKVYCIELDRIFDSIIEIKTILCIEPNNIKASIKRNGTCGGYHWMYYEDYLKLQDKTI